MTTSVPSDPADRQQLKLNLVEMTKCLLNADKEREHMKDIADIAHDAFGIPKKTINKLARIMYKQNYADLQAENEDFEFLYEALVLGKDVGTGE